MSTPRYDTGMDDALRALAEQISVLGEQVAAQVAAIDDPFERARAAAPLERQLRRGPDAVAKHRRGAIVQLYQRQRPKNVAALARDLGVSSQRIRTVLIAAGVLEPEANGRRKRG
jgi:hypothetical protein